MHTMIVAFLLLALVPSPTNGGHPLLFLPQLMLPPPGITFTFAYDLVMGPLRIPSVYSLEAVLAPDSTTVIGYRNWFQSEYGASYIVSLTNGSYFQANVDLNTRECTGVLVQTVDCAGWSSVDMLRFDNWCQIRPVDTQFLSHRTLIAYSSMTDPKLPVSVTETTSTIGLPDKMTVVYQFASKNEKSSFPNIRCYF